MMPNINPRQMQQMMKKKVNPEIVFAELKGDLEPTVVESLCVEC